MKTIENRGNGKEEGHASTWSFGLIYHCPWADSFDCNITHDLAKAMISF